MVDQKLKQRALHRAKIIKGQLEGLAKAIDREDYCTKLLAESLSIQRSLQSLDRLLLENHLHTHVKHQMQIEGQDGKTIQELIKIYTLANNK